MRLEARQKLRDYAPETLGLASRISGITPADISVLSVWIKKLELLDKKDLISKESDEA